MSAADNFAEPLPEWRKMISAWAGINTATTPLERKARVAHRRGIKVSSALTIDRPADGSFSAMLGSESTWVIGAPSIFNIGTYRDPIQRYGFKAA